MNSEVRFRLKRGAPVARDAILLVNKPRVTMPHYMEERIITEDNPSFSSGFNTMMSGIGIGAMPQVEYTISQPR